MKAVEVLDTATVEGDYFERRQGDGAVAVAGRNSYRLLFMSDNTVKWERS